MSRAKAALEMSRQDRESTIVNRDSLEADVASAKAALELAQIDLQNTQIIAPTGGQLGQISVRLGAYVSAGTHLTSLVPPQHWVIANLKETQLAEVRVGQPVTFTVDALNGETFHGKVQSISPGDRGGVQRHLSGQRHRQFRQDRPAHPGAYYGQRRAKQQRTPAAGDVGAGDY
ncbi:HlyD family secretion protein [Klebsiella pneumoniae IS43]|uniref:HlyD family secretion protein n=1 Tax=Klebsiella pneumoniae IS43 TaxID=1432552 RepID=W1DJG8_KLEPN|nr:HlyD family secretion protein [Klebsiella pneumoniae IS43]